MACQSLEKLNLQYFLPDRLTGLVLWQVDKYEPSSSVHHQLTIMIMILRNRRWQYGENDANYCTYPQLVAAGWEGETEYSLPWSRLSIAHTPWLATVLTTCCGPSTNIGSILISCLGFSADAFAHHFFEIIAQWSHNNLHSFHALRVLLLMLLPILVCWHITTQSESVFCKKIGHSYVWENLGKTWYNQ